MTDCAAAFNGASEAMWILKGPRDPDVYEVDGIERTVSTHERVASVHNTPVERHWVGVNQTNGTRYSTLRTRPRPK